MKSLKFLLVLSVVLLVSACKKDSEDLIVGDWKVASLIISGCSDPEDNAIINFTDGCYKESEEGFEFEVCMSVTFTSDGRYTFTTRMIIFGQTQTETETGTYTIKGNILRLCDTDGDCDEGEFTVTSNTLTFKGEEEDTGCKTELRLVK